MRGSKRRRHLHGSASLSDPGTRSMEESVLKKTPRIGVTASFYEEKNHIFLRVSPSEQRRMLGTLGQLDPAMPLVFLTQVDTRANACMYWLPGQK